MVESNKTFQWVSHLILGLLSICCLFPFLLLLIASFSSERSLVQNGYSLFPSEFSLEAYQYIFAKSNVVFRAYGITIFITVTGIVSSLLITILLAYPLSREELPHKNVFNFIVVFAMLFNGGLVPFYIVWTRLFAIKNTIFALLLPNLLMNAFNIMLVRTYFKSNIPEGLVEAARIDGAGEAKILFRIIIPISKPIIATLGLMVGLGYWNDWTNGLYFVTEPKLYSIQQLLNQMLLNAQFFATLSKMGQGGTAGIDTPTIGVRMAIAVIGIIPVVAAYPFFQKFFIKGITIGAIKG